MMFELLSSDMLMKATGVRIEPQWFPSAVNRYSDALLRMLDPWVCKLRAKYGFHAETVLSGTCGFHDMPVGDDARCKLEVSLNSVGEGLGYELSRIYNPPFNILPLMIQMLEKESGTGVVWVPK